MDLAAAQWRAVVSLENLDITDAQSHTTSNIGAQNQVVKAIERSVLTIGDAYRCCSSNALRPSVKATRYYSCIQNATDSKVTIHARIMCP